MDDSMWASFSLSLLERQCEQAVLATQLTWHIDILGNLQVPQQILQAINCPNLCSGNGFCNGRHCVCSPGYTSHDCSHMSAGRIRPVLPPYLYMAANNSVCDLHVSKCHQISILGQDFIESTALKCRVSDIDSEDEDKDEDEVYPAKFISSSQVDCILDKQHPILSQTSGTRILKIAVTNDGESMSNEIYLTLVDTTCNTCPEARMPESPTNCEPISGACRTKHGCRLPGNLHPRKPCVICSGGRWISTSSPVFSENEVAVQLIKGEKFIHNIKLLDSDSSIKLGKHPAGVLLQGHVISWNTQESQSEGEHVIELVGQSDGCRKKDKLLIRVEVVNCTCQNGGDCIRGPDHVPACICPPQYTGERCEVLLLDPCVPNPCFYGTCEPQQSFFTCQCEPGFQGTLCEKETDPCSSNPCFPGVTCSSSGDGSFSCGSCPGNLVGDGKSCTPPGLCNPNPCYPGVKCTPLNWYFQCGECPPGFTGDGISCFNNKIHSSDCEPGQQDCDTSATEQVEDDEKAIDLLTSLLEDEIEDMNPCDPNPCYQNVSCYIGPGDMPLCGDCPEGMQGDGTWCSRDYCSPSPCHPGVECTSTLTGFQCAPCPQGYAGNGISCSDLCTSISCFPGVECLLVDAMPVCGPCPSNMIGDGRNCVLDACSSNPCFHNVDCRHTNNSYECGPCPRGLVGDGVECYQDTCASSPCYPGVKCTPHSSNNFTCASCPPGYVGDGIKCEVEAESLTCGLSACFPGVLCIQDETVGEKCGDCPPGYIGDGVTCSLDHCQRNNPCFRGVSCYNFADKAKCGQCPPGFIGDGVTCNAVVEDPCSLDPCYPGVTCLNLWMGHSKGFLCGSCPESMVGDGINCWKTDVCASSPCFPGVTCTPGQNGEFTCGSCPEDLVGDGVNCFAPGGGVDHCQSSPCYPGVSCKSRPSGYLCAACPPGMHGNGSVCKDIDDCSPNPCYPGVACRDEPAPGRGYTCGRCPKPLLGDGTICTSPRVLKCPPGLRCYPGVDCVEAPGDQITCGSCPPGMIGNGLFCKLKCSPPCNAHQKCSKQHCSSLHLLSSNETVADVKDTDNLYDQVGDLLERREEFEVTKYTSLGKRGPMYSVYRTPQDEEPDNQSSDHSSLPKCKRKCRNGGVCVGKNKCSCPPQWRGKSCRKPRCRKGCRNGGKCIAPDKCLCTQNFTGKSCKRAKCGLNGVKCENGGKCRKSGRCRCLAGYHGRYCTKHINSVLGNKNISYNIINHHNYTKPG